ncbi:hypothetical protein C4559_00870 [Candidatus Microgenomates bacterium]|nr:MAG: hypothetical protein C4559_00870 [Candidatus Microgenomates bacterium]
MSGYKQISLLPWLELKDIQVGNVIFWKYNSTSIKNTDIKSYVDKYVKCYIDKHLKPVKTIAIASYKDKNYLEPLSDEEYQSLNFARDILCFLCISEQSKIALTNNNFSMGPPSADIFDMVFQNFIPGTEDISVKSGSKTSGGWTLDEIHFQEPWSTGGFFKNINRYVLTAINKLLTSQQHEDFKNRLLRSTEWFRLAHLENGAISPFFRIVMMATAFEIIFDIPNIHDKKGFLADKIDQTLAQQGHTQVARTYGKNNKESKTRSVIAWWVWDFYKLRNSIVHGDNISLSDLIYSGWITQTIVSDMIFYAYITYLLREYGYFEDAYIVPDFSGVYKIFDWIK